jgi:hypothetical protein
MMRAAMAARWSAGLSTTLLALCLAALLAACGAGSNTLATTGSAPSSANTPPPVTLAELKGLPPAKSRMLTAFIAEAAGKRDIAIVQGAFGEGYRLDGSFKLETTDKGILLAYRWTLADGKGQRLHDFSGSEPAGVAAGDPWAAAGPELLRRIAEAAAQDLARRLAELGFATRPAPS